MGDRLDDLTDEGRREVLQFLLDGATIDGDYKVQITLAVPVEDSVSIEPPVSVSICGDSQTCLESRLRPLRMICLSSDEVIPLSCSERLYSDSVMSDKKEVTGGSCVGAS